MKKIRNIGIIAHVDAGKTTLSERILLYTGLIRSAGETHEGAARLDHQPEEKKHGITITAAAVTCPWRDHQINLIDTPGHADFTIEVERSLRVLDGAVCVFDGVAGVEAQTEAVWRQARKHDVPLVCFVNKLDRVDADLDRVVEQIGERLAKRPVVVTAPLGRQRDLIGVIDVALLKAVVWTNENGSEFEIVDIPDDDMPRALGYRESLVLACAELDDSVLKFVLEETHVNAAAIRRVLRTATLSGQLTPVLSGSAYRNIGVQPLLDAVVDLLPSPAWGPPLSDLVGRSPRNRDEAEPFVGLCFKVSFDRHGQTNFVRVYSGTLGRGDKIARSHDSGSIRVSRLVRMFADSRDEVDVLAAGDIGAVVGPALSSGETLCAIDHPFLLEAIESPAALVEVAIEALTAAQDEKLGRALARLVRADPSLRLSTDAETGQRRLAGMGQLHIEISIEKLKANDGLEARVGPPQVAYRQTAQQSIRHQFTLRKQTGGPGMYAKVDLRIGPAPRGTGLSFSSSIRGGAVPREYVRGVRDGIACAMELGVGGTPVTDLVVELLDGDTHSKDSSELAFKMAAMRAMAEALESAPLIMLEPITAVEVEVGQEHVGKVVADIARRRGRVIAIEPIGSQRALEAHVPLAETFGYAGALSAMTGGRGQFRQLLRGYEQVV